MNICMQLETGENACCPPKVLSLSSNTSANCVADVLQDVKLSSGKSFLITSLS